MTLSSKNFAILFAAKYFKQAFRPFTQIDKKTLILSDYLVITVPSK